MYDPNPQQIRAHLGRRLDDDEEDEEKQDAAGRQDVGLDKHLLEARTLILHGPITDKLAAYCAARLMVMESTDPERPITVMINSPGGSADSGFAIYDMLNFVAPPIHTIVNGLCASAGILVLLGGADGFRFSTPESRFMMHQPSTTGMGTASDLSITAEEVVKLRFRYSKIISERSGQPLEQVMTDMKRDFWLNAQESLDYGLVSKIAVTRRDLPET